MATNEWFSLFSDTQVHHLDFTTSDHNPLLIKMMWGQRAKVQWLKDGDRNTRFFHSKASQRRRKNYIRGLYDKVGQWCTNPSRVEGIVLEFYQALFTSQNPENFDEILAQMPQLVTDEMNNDLMTEFQKEEVETALK